MKRLGTLALLLAVAFVASLAFSQRSNAVECLFTGTLDPVCDGHCVVFYFGTSASCGGTVELQRRSPGGSTWTTVATNISSPYTYCPANCGISCEYEYQLKLTCGCGGPAYSGVLGPIDCQ